jgi:hypothetical protein
MHLMWTFFSCRIQPLWRWQTKMWMCPGLSYPNHPSTEELSPVEVEAQIHKLLDLGVNPNSSTSPVPIPLRGGIAMLGLVN